MSKVAGGRLLGRCHAALGEDTLSVVALDAALEAARTGGFLLSEALCVKEKALLGRAAACTGGGSRPHWEEQMGKRRLSEVMGRMIGSKALLEKLLLHG